MELIDRISDALHTYDGGYSSVGRRVVIFGTGISALAGEVVSDYADEACGVPIFSYEDRRLPGWVTSEVDGIIVSGVGYSEEALATYDAMVLRGCRVFCIMPDGWIAERCRTDGNTLLMLPSGMDPEGEFGYSLAYLCGLLEDLGVCDARTHLLEILPDVKDYALRSGPHSDDVCALVGAISGLIPAFYSGSDMRVCSKGFKMGINNIMRIPSFFGEIPEFDHNELVGWADPNTHARNLSPVVFIGDPDSLSSRLATLMREVLEEHERRITFIDMGGEDSMARNICGIFLCMSTADALSEKGRP